MEYQQKPVIYSVALVIYNSNRSKYLLVKRPLDDNSMSGYWGFPAASKESPNDKWEETAKKVASTKLGVDVELGKLLGEDTIDRGKYILVLRDYEAAIVKGTPKVPQKTKGITQYIEQKWSNKTEQLIKAAQDGSLCSRVFLRSKNITWQHKKHFTVIF